MIWPLLPADLTHAQPAGAPPESERAGEGLAMPRAFTPQEAWERQQADLSDRAALSAAAARLAPALRLLEPQLDVIQLTLQARGAAAVAAPPCGPGRAD